MALAGVFALLAVLVASASAAAAKSSVGVTPIQKVLTLMSDMIAKGTQEKQDEATKFSAFAQWCTDQKRVKIEEIKKGNEKIDSLSADILKKKVTIQKLTDRIQELDEDVVRWGKDIDAATEVRKKEETDYITTLEDYSETIQALTGAIKTLKEQDYDREQPSFVQTLSQLQSRRSMPPAAKLALHSFLQQSEDQPEGLSVEAPEANSYEFQSGGVLDMLVKLKGDFDGKKRDLMEEEMKAKHSYNLVAQQLADNIEMAKQELTQKEKVRAQTQKGKAEAEGNLAQTTAERDEDQKYLQETTNLCQQKAADFESRQELRAEELEVLKKAKGIIADEAVAGTAEKSLPTLIQATATSLVQARADPHSVLRQRLVAFFEEQAQATGSAMLAQVSQHLAADPFGKVKKLIKDLISKLMQEGTEETEHKGWCDAELSKNKVTRDARTEDISALKADIDDLNADITQLTQDLADLAAQLQELEEAMAESTEERMKSKEANEKTVEEAKAAQTAVEQAMAVVKTFYEKSAQATALAQQDPAADAPETFDKPYKGMLPEGGNIVDFLEVILTDFARLESETSTAEATEKDQYDEFMFQSRKSKALKENDSKHKAAAKSDKESSLHAAEEELKRTEQQLSAAVAYYDKLKPTCVDSGISYEERVKRREAEMQSLTEALKIISGEDLA